MKFAAGIANGLATLLLISLPACRGDRPRLDVNQMKHIMWDLSRVDDFTDYYVKRDSSLNAEAERQKFYAQVLDMHDTDSATFFASMDWYRKRPEQMKILIDSLYNFSNRERESSFQRNSLRPIRRRDEEPDPGRP